MRTDPNVVPTIGGSGDIMAVTKAYKDTIVDRSDIQDIQDTPLTSQNIARTQAAG